MKHQKRFIAIAIFLGMIFQAIMPVFTITAHAQELEQSAPAQEQSVSETTGTNEELNTTQEDPVPVEQEQNQEEPNGTNEEAPEEEPVNEPEFLQGEPENEDPQGLRTQLTNTPLSNEFSGALTYQYPIHVPPGRNGLEPSLALSYNSHSRQINSLYGKGWGGSMPYIERDARYGVNNLYSDDITGWKFSSSLDGELINPDLVVGTERIYAHTRDGRLLNKAVRFTKTWAEVRNEDEASESSFRETQPYNEINNGSNRNVYELSRSTIPFDTSILPDTAVITSAALTLHLPKIDTQTYDDTYIVTTEIDGSLPLARTDYGKFNDQIIAPVLDGDEMYSLSRDEAAVHMILNEHGVNDINPQGFTTYGVRLDHDYRTIDMTDGNNYGRAFFAAESTNPDKRPYLDISYYALNDPTPNTLGYVSRKESGAFTEYEFVDQAYWVARTQDGLTYTFGQDATARQDDPSNPNHVARWMLQEVRDQHGNYITYTYTKDQGQIYPNEINYTEHSNVAGIFDIKFITEPRSDVTTSYAYGFGATTQYRIGAIEVYVKNVLRRKYDLSYQTGNDGVVSLLQSITETGYETSGTPSALPPTTFTYQSNNTSDVHWRLQNNHAEIPETVTPGSRAGSRFADLSLDGRFDIFTKKQHESEVPSESVHIQQPNDTWQELTPSAPFPALSHTYDNESDKLETRVKIGDANGDGLLDVVYSGASTEGGSDKNVVKEVYINKGNHVWEEDPQYNIPVELGYYHDNGGCFPNNHAFFDFGTRLIDVNGDGHDDIVQSFQDNTWRPQYSGPTTKKFVYFNKADGTGWDEPQVIDLPFITILQDEGSGNCFFNTDEGLRFFDVNGDGLPDAIQSYETPTTTVQDVYINIDGGVTWMHDPNYEVPVPFVELNEDRRPIHTTHSVLQDFTGDGRVDILYAHDRFGFGFDIRSIYSPTGVGTGWSPYVSTFSYQDQSGQPYEDHQYTFPSYFLDVEGDGFLEWYKGYEIWGIFSQHNTPDLLSSVTNPYGATANITYEMLAQHKDQFGNVRNMEIPANFPIVKQVTQNDGLNNAYTTNYIYEGGTYFRDIDRPDDNTLAGFHIATKTQDDGTFTKTYFHQANDTNSSQGEYEDHRSKIGHPYRVEHYDSVGNVMTKAITKWEHTPRLGDDSGLSNFVRTTQQIAMDYDGDIDHRDRATTMTHDTNTGVVLEQKQWGEVNAADNGTFTDIGNDARTATFTYATSLISGQSSVYPSTEKLSDQSGQQVALTRYYYDNKPLGQVEKGLITKNENWIGGSDYRSTTHNYNTYGLMTWQKDPHGNKTTFVYEGKKLYPKTIKNALNQSTKFVYDFSTGATTRIVDPNGFKTQNKIDGLGRLVNVRQSRLTDPTKLDYIVRYYYTVTGTAPSQVRELTYFGDANRNIYTYYDGLQRPVQARKRAETGSTYNVVDTQYDHVSRPVTQSLPYANNGLNYTSPIDDAELMVHTTYDVLDRPTSVTNILGTTTTTYDQWKHTITDPLNNKKEFDFDAYNQLTDVHEFNDGQEYITTYQYNTLGNLTKLTDANSNVRNFTYDALGRRLTAQDIHDPNDTTFGTYQYVYDDADNLQHQITPNNDTIRYTYDNLHRLETETLNAETTPRTTYMYDNCLLGKGRVCQVITSDLTSSYEYDIAGNLAKQTQDIDGQTYIRTATYGRQGNLEVRNLPNELSYQTTYNRLGLLESVEARHALNPTYHSVIDNLNYDVTDAIKTQAHANGVTTTYTYDPDSLYRLTNKQTTSGASDLQDFTYTYDIVGNIETITDASDTDTAKTVTYGYDDLYRLLSATTTGAATEDYTRTYTYNPIGNILTKSDQADTYEYEGNTGSSYANAHAVTSIGDATYEYDNNGNLLSDGVITNTWSYDNRLLSTDDGTTLVTYAYDPAGMRIKKTATTQGPTQTEETWIYPFADYTVNPDGGYQGHVSVDGMTFASIEIDGTQGKEYHVHTDHLGGTHVTTNEQGNIDQVLDYYPYGDIRINDQSSSHDQLHKYTGHEIDSETGLVYAQQRYYNGSIGRFLSQDPISTLTPEEFLLDPQQLNTYSYVRNNPMMYVDPTGLFLINGAALDEAYNSSSIVGPSIEKVDVNWSGIFYGISDTTNEIGRRIGSIRENNNLPPIVNESSYIAEFVYKDILGGSAEDAGVITDPDATGRQKLFSGIFLLSDFLTGGGKTQPVKQKVKKELRDTVVGSPTFTRQLQRSRVTSVNGHTIPGDWTKTNLASGKGIRYIDPNNTGNTFRIYESGKLRITKNGHYIDSVGNVVERGSGSSHMRVDKIEFD